MFYYLGWTFFILLFNLGALLVRFWCPFFFYISYIFCPYFEIQTHLKENMHFYFKVDDFILDIYTCILSIHHFLSLIKLNLANIWKKIL